MFLALRKKLGDDAKEPASIRTIRGGRLHVDRSGAGGRRRAMNGGGQRTSLLVEDPASPGAPQRRGISLYVKILLLFFLNVALLAAAGFFLVRSQLRPESLLAGMPGERFRTAARLIEDDLRDAPRDEWDRILDEAGAPYGVRYAVYTVDGTAVQNGGVAGEPPPDLWERLKGPEEGERPERDRDRMRIFLPGGEDNGPGPPDDRRGPPDGFGGDEPPPPRGEGGRRSPGPPMALASDRSGYWLAHRIAPGGRGSGRIPRESVLVMQSESLTGGGLLFDLKPWLLGGVGALVLSALVWLPFARGITRYLRQLTAATERIAAGEFSGSAADARRDEFGRLGRAINRMARRLEGYVSGQKRFLGDIAHELCSPIARLKMALAVIEQRAGAAAGEHLNDAQEEAQHMSDLVDELLAFSKASIRSAPQLSEVALLPAVQRAAERELGGEEAAIDIPENLSVYADESLLIRAIANVLRNAARYASASGPIEIRADEAPGGDGEGGTILLAVADRGPGVPEEDLPKLFDPFYRPQLARERESGGSGLGLTIVKACAEACGGKVRCHNREGGGFVVEFDWVKV
ncbi:MAG: ATP-binding protein [Verrucomicrobiales bacterium]